MQELQITLEQAMEYLAQSGDDLKVAMVMGTLGCDKQMAITRLAQASGSVARAINQNDSSVGS
jgi:N-acetylmuramic acid 6-phosphate (MurNAc-6-P) etherase